MESKDDWRLSKDQEDYLYGKKVKRRKCTIHPQHPGWHVHCELCYATISPYPGDEQDAYQTEDGLFWICSSCFADLGDRLHLSEDR